MSTTITNFSTKMFSGSNTLDEFDSFINGSFKEIRPISPKISEKISFYENLAAKSSVDNKIAPKKRTIRNVKDVFDEALDDAITVLNEIKCTDKSETENKNLEDIMDDYMRRTRKFIPDNIDEVLDALDEFENIDEEISSTCSLDECLIDNTDEEISSTCSLDGFTIDVCSINSSSAIEYIDIENSLIEYLIVIEFVPEFTAELIEFPEIKIPETREEKLSFISMKTEIYTDIINRIIDNFSTEDMEFLELSDPPAPAIPKKCEEIIHEKSKGVDLNLRSVPSSVKDAVKLALRDIKGKERNMLIQLSKNSNPPKNDP